MINKHMKKFSTSLITREIQIKTMMRSSCKPLGWSVFKNIIKTDTHRSAGKDGETLKALCITGENVKNTATMEYSTVLQ